MITKVPLPLRVDAYTIGNSVHASPESQEYSNYHIVNRKGFNKLYPFVKDSRIIFHGLKRIISDCFSEPITKKDLDETEDFLSTFHAGGIPYRWNRNLWEEVIKQNKGFIPIRIEAMLDGSIAFPYEPVIQVSADYGFGELAGYFESKLVQVWATSERATIMRWWYDYLQTLCRKCHPSWTNDQVDFACSIMCHDFGDRGSSCEQESEVLGGAHLLTMMGTDTVSAAYLDWANNNKRPWACSIHALAHRTVMGYMKEQDAHIALYNLGKNTGITAHVCDTNDFFYTVEMLANKMVNDPAWNKDTNLVVMRPDSGNDLQCIMHICNTAVQHNLFTVDPDTGLKMATRIRWIDGNSVDFSSMMKLIAEIINNGFSPFGFGAFGVGGALRNNLARDHSGLSMKLSEYGDNQIKMTAKRSEDVAKHSIPGIVSVLDNAYDENLNTVFLRKYPSDRPNLLHVWYDGLDSTGRFKGPCIEPISVVRDRVRNRFFNRAQPKQVIDPSLIKLRNEILADARQNLVKE